MNKRRGFTLVELLGVIVLLALIVLITFPSIINVIKKSDNSISEANKALIINAAKQYVEKNKNDYVSDGIYCLITQNLINNGFLIESISEADGTKLTNVTVKVTVNNSSYNYEVLDKDFVCVVSID